MSKAKHDDDLLLTGLRLDERAGPARRISRDQGLAMIESALDIWQGELPAAPRKRSWLPAVAVAASLMLALVGGASAARWYFGKAEPKPTVEAIRPARKLATHVVQKTSLPAITLEAEPLEAEREEPSAPRVNRSVIHDKAEPEDLLQRANRLRAEGRFQSAADTYAQVYERYPRSLSAYAAQVAAASIELEHLDKPDRARRLFESALRSHPKGALDLEARQGLSLALRELGRDRDEVSSLRTLIRDHGESPAARRAEARLKELTSAP